MRVVHPRANAFFTSMRRRAFPSKRAGSMASASPACTSACSPQQPATAEGYECSASWTPSPSHPAVVQPPANFATTSQPLGVAPPIATPPPQPVGSFNPGSLPRGAGQPPGPVVCGASTQVSVSTAMPPRCATRPAPMDTADANARVASCQLPGAQQFPCHHGKECATLTPTFPTSSAPRPFGAPPSALAATVCTSVAQPSNASSPPAHPSRPQPIHSQSVLPSPAGVTPPSQIIPATSFGTPSTRTALAAPPPTSRPVMAPPPSYAAPAAPQPTYAMASSQPSNAVPPQPSYAAPPPTLPSFAAPGPPPLPKCGATPPSQPQYAAQSFQPSCAVPPPRPSCAAPPPSLQPHNVAPSSYGDASRAASHPVPAVQSQQPAPTMAQQPGSYVPPARVCASQYVPTQAQAQVASGGPARPQAGQLDPGDPRTLAYGTDKGRWLQEQVRMKAAAGASPNPFRARSAY